MTKIAPGRTNRTGTYYPLGKLGIGELVVKAVDYESKRGCVIELLSRMVNQVEDATEALLVLIYKDLGRNYEKQICRALGRLLPKDSADHRAVVIGRLKNHACCTPSKRVAIAALRVIHGSDIRQAVYELNKTRRSLNLPCIDEYGLRV